MRQGGLAVVRRSGIEGDLSCCVDPSGFRPGWSRGKVILRDEGHVLRHFRHPIPIVFQ